MSLDSSMEAMNFKFTTYNIAFVWWIEMNSFHCPLEMRLKYPNSEVVDIFQAKHKNSIHPFNILKKCGMNQINALCASMICKGQFL